MQKLAAHNPATLSADTVAAKITRDEVEPLAQGIVAWHQGLATTCVFRNSAFADNGAKTNLAVILSQHGLANVHRL